jgi:predicted DNA-binding antitoxin AbrB/MazE fold protein
MVKKIRARYSDGVLTPLGMLDLPEGEVVTLTVEVESQLSKEERLKKMKSAAGAWADDSEYWDEMKQIIYESRITGSRTALQRLYRQEFLQGGEEQDAARLSAREWLEEVRKHKEASPTRVKLSQILEARDADRR